MLGAMSDPTDTHRSVRWILAAIAVVAAVIFAFFAVQASLKPMMMCWDGEDDDGNPIGGCEVESYRFDMTEGALAWVLCAVMLVAAVTLAIRARRRPADNSR